MRSFIDEGWSEGSRVECPFLWSFLFISDWRLSGWFDAFIIGQWLSVLDIIKLFVAEIKLIPKKVLSGLLINPIGKQNLI